MNKLRDSDYLPPKPTFFHLLKGFVGGFLGIFLLSYLGQFTEVPWVMAPFGATCVLLFVVPTSAFAQPQNILGGYLSAGTVGLVALYTLGNTIPVLALAVGVTIVIMQFFRVVHPPAGAVPLVIMLTGQGEIGFDFLIMPIFFGSLLLIGLALVINNLGKKDHWPEYWFGFKHQKK